MKVTNPHHFCEGVTLEIDNKKKLTWTVDKNSQKFKYGTIRVEEGGEVAVLDPAKSVDDFIRLVNLVFEFTGCSPDKLRIEKSEVIPPEERDPTDDEDMTTKRQRVLDLIYQTPLERKAQLVWFNYECGCNDPDIPCRCGGCPEPKIPELMVMPLAKTYGDILKSLGEHEKTGGVSFYDYPDSVWLFLQPVRALEKAMASIKEKAGADFDEQTLYLRFYYNR